MTDNLQIEVVLRKDEDIDFSKFKDIIDAYIVSEFDDKIILNFPLDWIGFNNQQFLSMVRHFSNLLYVALVYFALSDEIVTDADGKSVDCYTVTVNGKKGKKYVKKNIRILKIINEEENVFEVSTYVLDIRVSPPMIKVLDVYSGGIASGLKLETFQKIK